MGKGSGLFKFGMIRKLMLMNVLFFLAFGGIVLTVLHVFRNMEGVSKTLIDENITGVIANEQLGRDLGKVLSDTNLLVDTFLYGVQDVRKEGERIAASAAGLESHGGNPVLKKHLRELTGVLGSFFGMCAVVKEHSERLDARELKLNKQLTALEETLSEKLISRVMDGKDASILEQLSIIIPGYRETLLQISLEHVKLCLRQPGVEGRGQDYILLSLLDDLHMRMRTITASEPRIAGYGTRLMEEVTAYRKDTVLLVQALAELDRRLARVTEVKKDLVEDMKAVDAGVSRTTGEALTQLTQVMGASRGLIVVTSVVVISLLALFSAYFILTNIRRPMDLIRRGIESIREGNLDTRIRLERDDEWGVIEQALNDMVANLQTSYENLRGMNGELETARFELQRKVGELEDQIEERERTEYELKTTEEKWHSLYENLPGGSFTVNDHYIIEDVNDVLCAVTGFRREELIGRPCGVICPKGPHKCPIFDLGQERIDNIETAVKAKDGTIVPIIKSARRIPVGSKDVIVENFQDITDRKHLEDQLQHARKMEAVGQLAGGVAHDFNNILTAIIGYGTLLRMKFPEGDQSRAKVEQILGAAERASNLTRSLLTLSRKRVVQLEPLGLNACVSAMEELLTRLIREDIEFRTEIAAEALTVLGDKTQVEQILINLVTNARDSMPDGGTVTLRLEAMEMDDGVVASRGFGLPGKYAVLTVADTGVGMDPETRERIFEPFFTTKGMGKGTGLGLAIVYGITQQHGGFIEVLSEPGKGSSFVVYLPLIEAVHSEKTDREEAEIMHGTETVLLAEDEDTVRDLVRSVLEDYGYRVYAVCNGMEAVETFREHRVNIDLLLFDVIMPKMNGKDAYDEIRKTEPSTRALFMSGYTGDILNNKGILGEGLSFLAKPVAPSALLRKIRTILDA